MVREVPALYKKQSLYIALANVIGLSIFIGYNEWTFIFAIYLLCIFAHYGLTIMLPTRAAKLWIGTAFPIFIIFIVKYLPSVFDPLWSVLGKTPPKDLTFYFIGISYMAFRSSLYSFQLESQRIEKMSFSEYLSYVLFFPIMQVGPITRPEVFQKSFRVKDFSQFPLSVCIERVIFGLVKFQFIAAMFEQTSFDGLLSSGLLNHWSDVLYAGASYYLYIYFNFSGFCDIAIGLCGLVGIAADENFNQPLLARNIQDFWTRWHMTLSGYMREVIFTPLSLTLVRFLGLKLVDLSMVITIFISFTLIGVWHGKEEQFLIFGLIQASGVTINYFYGKLIKKILGPKRYKAYLQNRIIKVIAISMTFLFLSASFFFFANNDVVRDRILRQQIVHDK